MLTVADKRRLNSLGLTSKMWAAIGFLVDASGNSPTSWIDNYANGSYSQRKTMKDAIDMLNAYIGDDLVHFNHPTLGNKYTLIER